MRKRSIIRIKIWEGADITEILTAGVHAFVKQWFVHPSAIAVHPDRWQTGECRYMGIDVLRSLDIPADEIRFY